MKFQIKKFDRLNSTNAYALQNCHTFDDFTVITADEQTAGRGRKGRQWISPPGNNLYFTVILKNSSVELPHISSLPQIMALAVHEMLKKCTINNSWIKWPNDVYVNDKKICGILCESRINGESVILAVGVGININNDKEFLRKIDIPATSMLCESTEKTPYKADEVLHYVLMKFEEEYERWKSPGTRDEIIEKWRSASRLLGKQVVLKDDQSTIYGTAVDFNENGEIIIQTEKGYQTFSYGDLSLRIV